MCGGLFMSGENFFVIHTNIDIPSLFLVQGMSRKGLLSLAQHTHFRVTIFELKPQQAQSENPFRGIRLNKIADLLPLDDLQERLRYYAYALDGLTEDQLKLENERAKHFLDLELDRRLKGLQELLQDPQVEIIDNAPMPNMRDAADPPPDAVQTGSADPNPHNSVHELQGSVSSGSDSSQAEPIDPGRVEKP
jgi:hypothetical protein